MLEAFLQKEEGAAIPKRRLHTDGLRLFDNGTLVAWWDLHQTYINVRRPWAESRATERTITNLLRLAQTVAPVTRLPSIDPWGDPCLG